MTSVLDLPADLSLLDEAVREAQSAGAMIAKLQQKFLLVHVCVRRPTGLRRADEIKLTVDTDLGEQSVDESKVTRPRWRIIPSEWDKKLSKSESRIRQVVRRFCVPFALDGLHVVPVGRAKNLLAELTTQIDDHRRLTNEFVLTYDSIVDEIRRQFGSQFELVQAKVPGLEQIQRAFSVNWTVVPLGDPSQVDGRLGEFTETAQDSLREIVQDSIKRLIEQPLQEALDAAEDLGRIVNKSRIVRTPSIERFMGTLEKLSSFLDLSGTELLAKLQAAKRELGDVEIADFNKNARARLNVSESLVQLADQCRDELAGQGNFGKFLRGIDL